MVAEQFHSATVIASPISVHTTPELLRRRASASRATTTSSNGNDAVADHLVLLVPLAGDQHQIARPRQLDRSGDRLAPIDDGSAPAARCRAACRRVSPRRTSSMMRFGSSVRGLSDVMTTTSLKRPATAPISGRFVRSRSPPQPNTVISRPRRQRPRGLEQVSQRIVGMRVVDDDRDFVFGARHDLKSAGHAVERLECRVRSRRAARPSAVAAATAARML